jgi:hypothetical protein
MNSQSPPSARGSSVTPPPDSGNGKYIAIMALFGAGLVGLLAWKHFAADPLPVSPVPTASVAVVPPRPPPTDTPDIPPPPPVPDPTPDTGAPKVATSAGPGTNGCEVATCKGAMTSELNSALSFHARTVHKCYDEALAQDPTLKGQVVIDVKVGSNGTVCSSGVVSNELSNPSVAQCIATRFRQGARLPAPSGGCLETNVPIRLRPP